MTRPLPGAPGNVTDFTDAQWALLILADLNWGLSAAQLEPLLAVCIPDATAPDRARRHQRVVKAHDRYTDLNAGELGPGDFLDPAGFTGDVDDYVHAARVVAWFEVTDAVLAAAPVVTVDDHAEQALAVVRPSGPEAVAA